MKLPILAALSLGLLYAQTGVAAETATTAQPTTVTKTHTTKTTHTTDAEVSNGQHITATALTYPTVAGLNSTKEKISYAIGVDLGMNFKTNNIDVNTTILERGLRDTLAGNNAMMTKEQVAMTLMAFQQELIGKKKASFESASTKNIQEGKAFLAANKAKPGVVTTASGLQYKVITSGKGTAPADGDIVTVDYSGTSIDGKEFDSSYKRGKSVTFPVNEVIHGWTEALKLMQPGATYEVFIPSDLAYGPQGFGGVIGPNQTLVFKIHLVSVTKKSA